MERRHLLLVLFSCLTVSHGTWNTIMCNVYTVYHAHSDRNCCYKRGTNFSVSVTRHSSNVRWTFVIDDQLGLKQSICDV